MIISGDFNHTTLDSTLAVFYQVVDCPTRNNRTIDLLFANVQEAYRVTPLPPPQPGSFTAEVHPLGPKAACNNFLH